jgi:hypothetical protein
MVGVCPIQGSLHYRRRIHQHLRVPMPVPVIATTRMTVLKISTTFPPIRSNAIFRSFLDCNPSHPMTVTMTMTAITILALHMAKMMRTLIFSMLLLQADSDETNNVVGVQQVQRAVCYISRGKHFFHVE